MAVVLGWDSRGRIGLSDPKRACGTSFFSFQLAGSKKTAAGKPFQTLIKSAALAPLPGAAQPDSGVALSNISDVQIRQTQVVTRLWQIRFIIVLPGIGSVQLVFCNALPRKNILD